MKIIGLLNYRCSGAHRVLRWVSIQRVSDSKRPEIKRTKKRKSWRKNRFFGELWIFGGWVSSKQVCTTISMSNRRQFYILMSSRCRLALALFCPSCQSNASEIGKVVIMTETISCLPVCLSSLLSVFLTCLAGSAWKSSGKTLAFGFNL